MAKVVQGVYQIRNIISKRFYIGSSVNIYERWRTHKKRLRNGNHHSPALQATWNKHGEEAFKFEIIATCESVEDMDACEQGLIDTHYGDPLCCNVSKWTKAPWRNAGERHPNYRKPMPEEQKQKIREATNKQWATSDPRTGKKHSAEAKAKISAKVQEALDEGRGGKFIPNEETRKKMSESLKGNTNAKGHIRSEEHRHKLSEANKGNQNWLGKSHSVESKRKMGKPVVDSTNARWFDTQSDCLAYYGMTMPTLHRALKTRKPISRGKFEGLSFFEPQGNHPKNIFHWMERLEDGGFKQHPLGNCTVVCYKDSDNSL